MGTSHFRVTAAVPGSSVTYVTVGFPRKSSSKGVGGSREVNRMKFFFLIDVELLNVYNSVEHLESLKNRKEVESFHISL